MKIHLNEHIFRANRFDPWSEVVLSSIAERLDRRVKRLEAELYRVKQTVPKTEADVIDVVLNEEYR